MLFVAFNVVCCVVCWMFYVEFQCCDICRDTGQSSHNAVSNITVSTVLTDAHDVSDALI